MTQYELYKKYILTNDENYLKKIFKYNDYKIKNKIYKNYLQMYYEDILQEIHLRIWKNLKNYNPKKGSLSNYINIIIDASIVDYIKKIKRDKRYVNHISESINKTVNDNETELINLIEGDDSHEDSIIENIEFNRLLNKFLKKLTNIEKKSLLANIKNITGNQHKNLTLISQATGLDKKQIDNAFGRIKNKFEIFYDNELNNQGA